MSTAQFAVLGDARLGAPERDDLDASATRGLTLTAFMVLAIYGVLRWSTMLGKVPGGRLFGLLVLTLLIGWLGSRLSATRLAARAAITAGILVAALAMIPMSGFPLRWLVELHFGRLWEAVGRGLSALPHVIVPYSGSRMAVNGVIVLGAAMLLLAGALALCTPRRQLGPGRLTAAAIPLIVLAIVPTVLSEPRLAGVHGVILFLLLMALLFSERVASRRVAGAAVFALVAAVAALILSPVIETSHGWINVKTIGAGRVHVGERFNWSQTYGRLNWPHQGTDVLSVQARFPSYWKAEDIDLFNGSDWVSTDVNGGAQTVGVDRSSLARWTEPITVTLGAMSTSQIVAAGVASPPQSNGFQVIPGNGPGTWETEVPLQPHSSYQVDVYAPSPTRSQLVSAPASYPMSVLAPELQLILPAASSDQVLFGAPASPVQFTPFGSRHHVEPYGGLSRFDESLLVRHSPYARVFRLALSLRARGDTPYEYLESILRYLGQGFTYDQTATAGRYPLVNFLFKTRTGYCQQFAGAMAMLLRMGGVPARVAAGFTTGVYNDRTHTYSVSDLDAHTWVEAWFAGFGWVTFDPTPPSDPALRGHIALPAGQTSPAAGGRSSGATPALGHRRIGAAAPKGPRHQSQRSTPPSGRGTSVLPIVGVSLLLVLILGLAVVRYRRPRGPEGALAELERAFSRCGRPLTPALTLTGLERRLADVPEAAEYVRTLRTARYAGGSQLPTGDQRRALRRRLRSGLGPLGWARALFALPPLAGPSAAREQRRGGIH
ncbi:MAG TPA: transglutaminase domain-containing protein [Solirubrobacteraceae bacterium]|jgi:transglutaminase-like putative cysteine protease|nr:transglutaminase domain-containing protein [Solirubrobacteraceae bacterium]